MKEVSPEQPRPTSVTVLGIVNIILGSMWLFGGVCGAASLPLSMLVGQAGMSEYQLSQPLMAWSAIQSFVGAIVGLLFLLGGIGLLRSRPWGRTISIGAAIAKLVVSALTQGVSILLGASMLRGGHIPGMEHLDMTKEFMGLVAAMMLVGACLGLVFNMGYPVTLVVFMFTRRVRTYFAGLGEEGIPSGGTGAPPEEKGL
jgi:hypothetical protein